MSNRPRKTALIAAVAVSLAASAALAQIQVLVNNVGYESSGSKRAVVQSSSAIAATAASLVKAAGGDAVQITLGANETVGGWSGFNFKVADFSSFATPGEYRIKVGAAESPNFFIGEKILQAKTGADQLAFFKAYRSKDAGDRNLPIFGSSKTQNIYGGWFDASGDMGKHISHLSYANYFNPQQIPLVAWALLHAHDMQPDAFGTAALEEAAWGADFLLRALSSEGFFYMSVFDNWGAGYRWNESNRPGNGSQSKGEREICAWRDSEGNRTADYQCAMREGGGMSIAALARAAKANIRGDSTAERYLAGAERAYAHLKANPTKYQDDRKENIIDDYCGLLAAAELYNATGKEGYRSDADARAASLLGRQSPDGWFYSGKDNDGANIRPFYHAADEGLPVVALSRYYEIMKTQTAGPGLNDVRYAVGKNLRWYANITRGNGANPFQYAKMYRAAGAGGGGVTGKDLARGKTAKASREEGSYTTDKAFDGNATTRWSSYQSGAQNDSQWIYVDLGEVYKVNKVVLNWEASYGKHYRIDASTNAINWTQAVDVPANGSAGEKTHTFSPIDAKYVRMYGITRGFEYGGFSLYSFEVYGESAAPPPAQGPGQVRYFVPHDNETGYWWQGENARLASMSAAFTIGAPVADNGAALWNDTLFSLATAQLDWILGKNPFEICMMYGYGKNNYPFYKGDAGIEHVKGGICNGITAKHSDENDIDWKPYPDGPDFYENWRWLEQWIPHNAWYLTAVSAISNRIQYGIPNDPIVVAVKHGAPVTSVRLKISAVKGKGIRIELPFESGDRTEVTLYNIQGKSVYTHKIQSGLRAVSIRLPSTVAKGTYVADIKDGEGKNKSFGRIIVK